MVLWFCGETKVKEHGRCPPVYAQMLGLRLMRCSVQYVCPVSLRCLGAEPRDLLRDRRWWSERQSRLWLW